MIKHLDGIYETVDYQPDSQVCLYYNNEYENYPPHWHPSFELIMPVSNQYQVNCGKETFLLREGDVLIICPSVLHDIIAPETGERIIFQPNISALSIKELNLLVSMISPFVLITPEDYPMIYEQIQKNMLEIKEEYFSHAPFSESRIYSLFLEILVLVGRNQKSFSGQNTAASHSRQREYAEKFLYISGFLEEHFTENISLEKMADLAGFSKYHFSRLFRQYTGSTFYRYINMKRIDYAKSLLINPSLSVIEIAFQSGFSSLSAFLRMFKQINNCTPTEFRSMYSGKKNMDRAFLGSA
ncbi:MAG: helix-turn-helix transcriptional regulator [Blautia sp.]|nr:helix-turn-helix transcriptional regulator [Blautia sp.]